MTFECDGCGREVYELPTAFLNFQTYSLYFCGNCASTIVEQAVNK